MTKYDNIPGFPGYYISKRLGVSVGTIGRVINKKSYRDENIDRKR